MEHDAFRQVADLVGERNEIDRRLSILIGRPLVSGHLGEWIAAQVFDLALEESGSRPGYDGRFRSGALAGSTVNVKWYLARQGILDIARSSEVDYYLVLAGPHVQAGSSRGTHRPWVVEHVYLFSRSQLIEQLEGRHVGIATSVRADIWESAEIYPSSRGPLTLTPAQREALSMFAVPDVEMAARRAAADVLRAVQILHARGHEEVRVNSGLSPSGLNWRVTLWDARRSRGAATDQQDDRVLLWSTGDALDGPLTGRSSEEIADRIAEGLDLGAVTQSDRGYAEWLDALLGRCVAVDGLPVCYGDGLPPGWWVWRVAGDPEPWPMPPAPALGSTAGSS